jgi:regulator of protease activity HflC (stomatin/prohibitin superfamily)
VGCGARHTGGPTPAPIAVKGADQMSAVLGIFLLLVCVMLVLTSSGVRLVQQYQRGVVLRFGRLLPDTREPGLRMIIPFADRMTKVSLRTVVLDIPAQSAITRDNVSIGVDAVVYFRVEDPVKSLINVENYLQATSQVARTSLRSVIGRAELDTLLSDREQINGELKAVLDAPTDDWGIVIDRVEVKDISLPDGMRRSMSRQAEAERERRARVIVADAELQASTKLSQAASAMAATPGALQLRMLQTVVDVAAEKNSTLVMPFPVELLRFFDRATSVDRATTAEVDRATTAEVDRATTAEVDRATTAEIERATNNDDIERTTNGKLPATTDSPADPG